MQDHYGKYILVVEGSTPFYTHLAKIPNGAIGINPDTLGLGALAVVTAGIVAHGAATAVIKGREKIAKRKQDNPENIRDNPENIRDNPENIQDNPKK